MAAECVREWVKPVRCAIFRVSSAVDRRGSSGGYGMTGVWHWIFSGSEFQGKGTTKS